MVDDLNVVVVQINDKGTCPSRSAQQVLHKNLPQGTARNTFHQDFKAMAGMDKWTTQAKTPVGWDCSVASGV
jgi:hypothetical protein